MEIYEVNWRLLWLEMRGEFDLLSVGEETWSNETRVQGDH